MKKVYMLNLFVGRKRMGIDLEPEMLGIKLDTDEMKLLFKEHVELGKLLVLPKTKEYELNNFEQKVRRWFSRATVSYDFGGLLYFATEEMYKEIEAEFKEYLKEHEAMLEELMENYDQIVESFISLFGQAVDKKTKEKFERKMKGKIPMKEDYMEAFKFNLRKMNFHVNENPEVINRFLGKSLQVAFRLVNILEERIKANGKLSNKTLGAIKNNVSIMRENNITNDPKIEEIISLFERIYKLLGEGPNSKNLIKRIKKEVNVYSVALDVADMIK